MGVYLIGYGIVRLICERFRYDEVRGFFFGLSTSQWISILVIPVGILILWLAHRRSKKEALHSLQESSEGEKELASGEAQNGFGSTAGERK